MTDFNLGDIPDLSSLGDLSSGPKTDPFQDGWYQGTILAKREFTDRNGNDRIFESSDTPAQRSGRNIRLQVQLTRRADGKQLNISYLTNYQPTDLTTETLQQVAKSKSDIDTSGGEWDKALFRSYMTLQRLGKLQKIAGVRQFQRSPEGGLDLTPLFGKTAFFKVKPDDQNPAYKQIGDVRIDEPTKVPVL